MQPVLDRHHHGAQPRRKCPADHVMGVDAPADPTTAVEEHQPGASRSHGCVHPHSHLVVLAATTWSSTSCSGGRRPVFGQSLEPLTGGGDNIDRRGILGTEELRQGCLDVGVMATS